MSAMSATAYFSFNFFGFNPALLRALNPEITQLLEATDELAQAVDSFADTLTDFNTSSNEATRPASCTSCAPVEPPVVEDCCHPAGSLQVDGDVITTPGGYQIEMMGQYEWKITGPDGKQTRIWGDPHVAEGDGGNWDFKRNSTFVLPDGTRINVTTVPVGGSGMTVTGQLEIISGNDRVLVTDIDKGKGKIGTVTQDGFQHVNGFEGDVFVMGREADDWSYTGKEIVGSENGGESFKLGGELHPASNSHPPLSYEIGFGWIMSLLDEVLGQWSDTWRPSQYGCNLYGDDTRACWEGDGGYDQKKHTEKLIDAFRAAALMFVVLARIFSLDAQLSVNRNRPVYNFA